MKKFYHIVTWTILLIAIPACQRLTQYPLTIRQAETLMNIRPDSSLHLLQGMADSIPMLPEETQMYYHLLNIQAKDKLYITHTDDSLVNRIVEFYEEQGNKDRLMMAYFYQGSTYRDMNDAPRALKAFHSAVNQKEENRNLTLLGQAYGQMGTLLSNHTLYDEALESYQKSLSFYLETKEDQRIPLVYRNIARMHSAKEKNDSAIYFYEKAYQIALENNNSRNISSIASEMGCLYYETGKLKEAKHVLYPLAITQNKRNNAILYLGLIYDAENQKDSAFYFMNQVLACNDIVKQSVAHKTLAKLEKNQGNETKADYHQKQYQMLYDSIQAMTKTDNLKEDHYTYNYEHLKRAYETLRQENHRYRRGSIVFWILIATLICLASYVYLTRKKGKRALSTKHNNPQSTIYNEKVFQLFQKAGYNEAKVSENDWAELHKLIERELPFFTKELSRLSQELKLSQQELRICNLLKLGFINRSISNILRVSKSAISRSQSRMHEKMTGEKGKASKMRLFIEKL